LVTHGLLALRVESTKEIHRFEDREPEYVTSTLGAEGSLLVKGDMFSAVICRTGKLEEAGP
jgi:hypothetical protein